MDEYGQPNESAYDNIAFSRDNEDAQGTTQDSRQEIQDNNKETKHEEPQTPRNIIKLRKLSSVKKFSNYTTSSVALDECPNGTFRKIETDTQTKPQTEDRRQSVVSQKGKSACRNSIAYDTTLSLADGFQDATGNHNVESWHIPIEQISAKKYDDDKKLKKLAKGTRKFYKRQNDLILAFESSLGITDVTTEDDHKTARIASILAKVIFAANFILLIIKSTAAGLSGSLAIVSSVIDSVMDLVSGALLWWSNRAIRRNNRYLYPQGRTKLEPISIAILSVVMTVASCQVIGEAIHKFVEFSKDETSKLVFGTETIVIACVTIAIKMVLYGVTSRVVDNPSVKALAQDQRNDVISNSVALACGLIGARVWIYADPLGATLISLYIIITWVITGKEQIRFLSGYTAEPEVLKLMTWMTLTHHPKILAVDTVKAFHIGTALLAEVHIVLPEDMHVRESHDIALTLQHKLETLHEIEVAFVHVDYESTHKPESEHKIV